MFQDSEESSQPRVAPIFNRRKRPREAMMTFPEGNDKQSQNQRGTPNNTTDKSNSSWSSNRNSQQYKKPNVQQLPPPDPSKACYNPKNTNTTRTPQPTTSIKFGAGPSNVASNKQSGRGGYMGQGGGSGGRGQFSQGGRGNVVNVGGSRPGGSDTSGRGSGGRGSGASHSMSRGKPPMQSSGGRGYGSSQMGQGNTQAGYMGRNNTQGGYMGQTQSNNQTGYDGQSRGSTGHRGSYNNHGSTSSTMPSCPPPRTHSSQGFPDNQVSHLNPYAHNQPSVSHDKLPTKRGGSQAMERSMRLLTCSTADIRRCVKVNKMAVPLLVEIYGTVDSATTSTGSCGRQFVIRDDSGRIDCVFHEIDRQLDRLARGVAYRCVGSYNETSDQLTCVSVRRADDTEIKLSQTMRDLTDKVLTDLSVASREM